MDEKKFSQIFILHVQYDEYGKYDEFRSKIHYKFRKLSNLKTNLNEKYTAKFYIFETLHHTIMFQFNLMAFNWQMKGNYFSLYLIACKFRPSAKNSNIEINI